MTRNLKDLISCRSHEQDVGINALSTMRYQQCCGYRQRHLICTCVCKYLIYL